MWNSSLRGVIVALPVANDERPLLSATSSSRSGHELFQLAPDRRAVVEERRRVVAGQARSGR